MNSLSFLDKKTLSLIIAAIRKSFLYSMEYTIVKHQSLSDEKGPRGGKMFICNYCKTSLNESNIKVDHILPIVPLHLETYEMDLEEYYSRCHCKITNLQVLCKKCHDEKSAGENKKRREFKKSKKKLIEPKRGVV